jgi:Cys-rich protein (TIGR01571 family)
MSSNFTFDKVRYARVLMTSVRPWPTSLTECCASPGGLPRCCLAFWCPCFSYAELIKEPELKGYCCFGDKVSACVSYALLQALGYFPAAALHAGARSTLRTERNYSGSLAEDFCATTCCSTCALVQELNAADSRQATPSTLGGAVIGAPQPMRMSSLVGSRIAGSAPRPRAGTQARGGAAAPSLASLGAPPPVASIGTDRLLLS